MLKAIKNLKYEMERVFNIARNKDVKISNPNKTSTSFELNLGNIKQA